MYNKVLNCLNMLKIVRKSKLSYRMQIIYELKLYLSCVGKCIEENV